jgi:RNA polymerase sigma factor (sigma-70 family)
VKTRQEEVLLRQLDVLFNFGAIREFTDGQLLERFLTSSKETAELAFAALVERHGEMVQRVCRARLDNRHDIDDAFQATFLVLVKHARSLWVRDSLGPWLHQVALRTASCARSAAARRRRHERRFAERAAIEKGDADAPDSELESVLHEEIDRLPESYRSAIVLCDLEGLNCDEAARRLGRPAGTVKCWRFRGRERLRHRLQRRGLVPSAGIAAAFACETARAVESKSAAERTARAAIEAVTASLTTGEISPTVARLVEGVQKMTAFRTVRAAAAKVLGLVLLAGGVGAFAWAAAQDPGTGHENARSAAPGPALTVTDQKKADQKESQTTWPLSLTDAIAIGLQNTPLCRVIAVGPHGAPKTIGPFIGSKDLQDFRDDVMGLLYSIEKSYWNLGQAQTQLSAAEGAVKLARATLGREEADLLVGKGTVADVAEAAQRLEQFNLDLVTRTSDVITTERELRNALGLPAADGRRIVPSTPLTEAKLEPDWEKCLATMLKMHPQIVRAQALVTQAEGDTSAAGPARLQRAKAALEQAVHDATHVLARDFLQIDSSYKQFQIAARLRNAAAQRLDAQRAYYEEGRITIDRFLDAVSQHATAIATEAQYKAVYNITLMKLEREKGTLLDHDGIEVVDRRVPKTKPVASQNDAAAFGPRDRQGFAQDALARLSQQAIGAAMPPPPQPTPVAAKAQARSGAAPLGPAPLAPLPPATSDARTDSRTISFQFSIQVGATPIDFRGSVTIGPAPKVESGRSN